MDSEPRDGPHAARISSCNSARQIELAGPGPKRCNVLGEATLQVGQQELRRDDDVVEDGEVTAEAVAGAELRQRQVHLVHAAPQRREREKDMDRQRGGEEDFRSL